MAKITIGFGLALIVLGVISYLGTGMVSVTALIPAFAGIPILLLGFVALNERFRKHAMHVAMVLALVGGGGSLAMGTPKIITLLGGGEVARPEAAIVQTIMGVILLVFVVLGIRSFIAARRTAKASAE